MLGSVVLDVAIGMAFVYLLLSLIGSVIQEILATFMQLRPANLQRGIRSLLSGASLEGMGDLVDRVYGHGLVRGLYSDPHVDMKVSEENAPKLARVWSAVSRVDWLRTLLRYAIGIRPEKPIAGVSNQMLLPAYIPAPTFALTMIDLLNPDGTTGKTAMDAIRAVLVKNKGEKAAEAMLALAKDSQDDLEAFKGHLEGWYNAGMDRASGWYKKYTQTILLGIGMALAVAFNVDTIRVARTLWTDRDVRQGMADSATQYLKEHQNSGAKLATAPADANAQKVYSDEELKTRLEGAVKQFNSVASGSLLPVGWDDPKDWLSIHWHRFWLDPFTMLEAGWCRFWTFGAWRRLLGWFLTAMAISLGAPFWFDALNKFMVVRGTVKPAEKSKPEGSKDPSGAKGASAATGG